MEQEHARSAISLCRIARVGAARDRALEAKVCRQLSPHEGVHPLGGLALLLNLICQIAFQQNLYCTLTCASELNPHS